MEKITSLTNSKIKKWVSLHQKKYRDETGLFLVEGEHLIEEALKANCVDTIITDTTSPFDFENVVEVTPQIMKKLSTHTSDEHYIAVCHKLAKDVKKARRVVLLDEVQDPGNVGTIIRSAVSFGYDAIYLSENSCDIYNDKTIRSTQGALFDIPIITGNLKDIITSLKKDGFTIYSLALRDATPFSKVKEKDKMAFIFGNEGNGIHEDIIDLSDEVVKIEMQKFESLNVAIAAGIVLYKFQ